MNSTSLFDVPKEKPPFNADVFRDLSTHTILFHSAIADRLGLGTADHKCLDFVVRAPDDAPMTPGKLAELTGLTTGAITGVLDRLEEQGFVRREKDPNDRRQVIVRLLPQRLGELGAIFGPFLERVQAIASHYTPHELARIEDFARENIALIQEEIVRLRKETDKRGESDLLTHSLGATREGVLEIPHGSSNLTIMSCEGDDLYRARFEGQTPVVRVDRGHVSFAYKMSLSEILRFRRSSGRIEINRAIPWKLHVRGGAVAMDADLRAVRVREIDIKGGASEITIRLGPPDEIVSFRLRGGATKLRIVRPQGVATRIVAKGGVAGLAIDSMKLGSVGGTAEWQSPGFENASARYDIEVVGGASKLGLETG